MELSFAQQSQAFLFSIVLGLLLGFLYGLFKIIRIAFSLGKPATVITDVLFMILSSLAVFLFSLAYIQGYVRIYVLLGAFLGTLLYRATIGHVFSRLYLPVIGFLKKILSTILKKFKKIVKMLLKTIRKILYNKSGKVNKKAKKSNKLTLDNKRILVDDEGKHGK